MSNVTEIFHTMSYGPAPESAATANEWLDTRNRAFGHFINGTFTAHDPARAFATVNPATAQPIGQLTQANAEEIDAAVTAARKAQKSWAALSGHERAKFLYAIARHIQKHARLFSVLETMDNGKPIRETRDIDVPLVARHFYHHAGWAQLSERELAGYKPHGVVGQIIPWNFPLLMLSWKIAPALATGNTVVLKPAEWTSLTALLFAELCQQVGLPPGVVNIVTGDGEVGKMIVAHPDINKIAFTGSTEVGKAIRASTAGTGKALSLELGGKSPFIVFEDADLDSAVEGIVDAIWFNQGQVCCAGSRLLVQESIAPKLLARLRARMEKLRVGDPLDKAVDMGAIVAPPQLQKIQQLVAQGTAEGATLWQPSWYAPAAAIVSAFPKQGYFFPPTLFTDVGPASTIAQVEIFGPVLVSMTFRTPSEAVALANNTRFGLAASVWSEDINLALDIAPKLKAGVVWINCTNQLDAAAGFGGYRESGYGREGGREGLFEYVTRDHAPALPAALLVRAKPAPRKTARPAAAPTGALDRTPKLYIGGKQTRPDGGYSKAIYGFDGALLGEVGEGNRKDVRNAVEAARAAQPAWASATAHNRAQVLYYIAENLSVRAREFTARLTAMTGDAAQAAAEVAHAIDALFTYAALADKYDGQVHGTPLRNVTLAMKEPMGVIGIACPDELPLLATVTLAAGAISMGNAAVLVPSPIHPLVATDLYQVLDTSDLPGGVINIITGGRDELAKTLAEHNDIDTTWYFGPRTGATMTERASIGNLKRTWTSGSLHDVDLLLRHATQIKNIWVPYGS